MSDHKPRLASFKRAIPSYTLKEAVNLPPPSWLVKDLLPDGGLSFLVGPPGIGKTFGAIDLAMSVAYGRPFLGKDVRQGRVVYVAAEGHRSVARRMLAWCHYYGLEEELTDELIIIPDAIDLLGGDASADDFFAAVGDKFPLQSAITTDEEGQEHAEPIESSPVRLIIFDTLARCVIGADENSAEDMGQAVAFFDHLRKSSSLSEASDTHVMAIHHTNKMGTLERGSTVLRGAADTVAFVRSSGVGEGQLFTISKQRDSEEHEPIRIHLEKVHDLQSAVMVPDVGQNRPQVSRVQGFTRREKDVMEHHIKHHNTELGCSIKDIAEKIAMKRPNVVPVRRTLVKKGYLSALDSGCTVVTKEGIIALHKVSALADMQLRGDAVALVRQVLADWNEEEKEDDIPE